MYKVGSDRLLHLYRAALHPKVRRSVEDRRLLERDVEIAGLPKLHATFDDGDLIWVLEDRIAGSTPLPSHRDEWLPSAFDWLCNLAAAEGPALDTTSFWSDHYSDALEAAPADLKEELGRAFRVVARMPARPVHGDVQPKNLILSGRDVGLVDWEGFYRHGLPGLDVAFLATMSFPDAPGAIVSDLLSGRTVPYEELLRSALHRCGYSNETLRAGLLIMLSLWASGEARRNRRIEKMPPQTRFSDLLKNLSGVAVT